MKWEQRPIRAWIVFALCWFVWCGYTAYQHYDGIGWGDYDRYLSTFYVERRSYSGEIGSKMGFCNRPIARKEPAIWIGFAIEIPLAVLAIYRLARGAAVFIWRGT